MKLTKNDKQSIYIIMAAALLGALLGAGCGNNPPTEITATGTDVTVPIINNLETVFHFKSVQGKTIDINNAIDHAIYLNLTREGGTKGDILSTSWVWWRSSKKFDNVNFDYDWVIKVDGGVYGLGGCNEGSTESCIVQSKFEGRFVIRNGAMTALNDLTVLPDLTPPPDLAAGN